jgi:hypothetical protein
MGLAEDRAAFEQTIADNRKDPVDDTMWLLDHLIAWSRPLSWAIEFRDRSGSQKVVKFVLLGTDTPFWTAYPGKTRPTKLSVIDTAPPTFPPDVQAWARTELATHDRWRDPEAIWPLISFRALRETTGALDAAKDVLRELIDRLSPQRTRTTLLHPELPRIVEGATWLGHAAESGAGQIDLLLLDGARKSELEQPRGAVPEYLQTLARRHFLPVIRKWDHDVFDYRALGVPATVTARVTRQEAGKGGTADDFELRITARQSLRLPFGADEKADVTLRLGKKTFDARYHATAGNTRYTYLYHRRADGASPRTLGEFLAEAGIRAGEAVTLTFDGTDVTLTRGALPAAPPPPPEASDLTPPPRVEVTVSRIVRDTAVTLRVKEAHAHRCQLCGERIALPDGRYYAEAHHIRPLGGIHEGHDVAENVLCVCPTHHAELDFGIWDIALGKLRTADGHEVGEEYVRYQNEVIRKRWS